LSLWPVVFDGPDRLLIHDPLFPSLCRRGHLIACRCNFRGPKSKTPPTRGFVT
jgi:hypothetical protein